MSIEERSAIAIDQTQAQPDEPAVGAALAVLDRFMAALNACNEPALLATLHFPHYRLAGGRMRVWDQSGAYLGDFLGRAGADWHHSEWDFRKVIAAGAAKVHLGRAVHPLSRRQLSDWLFPLVVDRHRGRRPLGRGGSVELRGLICVRDRQGFFASWLLGMLLAPLVSSPRSADSGVVDTNFVKQAR